MVCVLGSGQIDWIIKFLHLKKLSMALFKKHFFLCLDLHHLLSHLSYVSSSRTGIHIASYLK